MNANTADEALVPILSVGNDYETPSVSTRLSSHNITATHMLNSDENRSASVASDRSVMGRTAHTSCLAAIFLTVNATLGAGLLNIPHAFNDSGGIFYALIIQTVFVVLIIGSLLLVTYCADMSNASSYQELIRSFCGHKWQHLCSVFIILYSYGACITFVIICGDQFDRIFLSLYGPDFAANWYMNRNFTMSITCALLILPLSFSKQIGFLKNASLLGFCSTFYLLFLVIFEYYKVDAQDVLVKTRPDNWTEVLYITPVLCFAYQCQLSWVPTYSGMKQKIGSYKTTFTIIVSIVICYVTYTLIAIFGLLTFGSELIENDLMSNYDANGITVLLGIIILIAKTITVYPLLLFCGRVAVDDFVRTIAQHICCGDRVTAISSEPLRRAVIVLVWVFSTIVVAVYVPNITIAIEFLGSFATLFVFIFPGICFLIAILIKDKNLFLLKDKIYIFIASLYIVLGVFIAGLTITQTIEKNLF